MVPAAAGQKDSVFRRSDGDKYETHSGPIIVMKMTKIAIEPRRMPCTVA
jgi:hypothetical protein